MKEKPILFSGPMVKAILEGRKTQTRRVVKPQPILSRSNPPKFRDTKPGDLFIAPDIFPSSGISSAGGQSDSWVFVLCENVGTYRCLGKTNLCDEFCPHGSVGDRLWVRETFLNNALDGYKPVYFYRADDDDKPEGRSWKPSIFMPRSASRITLEITGVRVERLQEIDPRDCIDEGIDFKKHECGCETCARSSKLCPATGSSLIMEYSELWDSINRKKHPWASNPWVWVISFKPIAPPEKEGEE